MLSSDVRWCVCVSCRKCLRAAWVASPGPGPASLSGQAEGKLVGSLVSECNLDFSDFVPCCWWASSPWKCCLPSQDPSFRRFKRSRGVPYWCRTGCHVALRGVSGCWAHKVKPLATEIFLSGPKGPNLLDSRIAKEGKHSGYRSSDVVVVQ